MKTEHGPASEASIRAWLESFLPSKYGVTSGYIIPGLISEAYTLYHYDVIIYDRLNSPTLWIEDNPDQSLQGTRRAIPAEHVYGVFEVKSSFNTTSAKDAINKLNEINRIATHLPRTFVSLILFFEIDSGLANKPYMIKHLCPKHSIPGYWGGLILRCDLNPVMTGLFELIRFDKMPDENDVKDDLLIKDVDTVEVWRTADGSIKLAHGASIFLYADGSKHHASKMHTCIVAKSER